MTLISKCDTDSTETNIEIFFGKIWWYIPKIS